MLMSHNYYVAEGNSKEGDEYGIYDGRGQSKAIVERFILRKASEERRVGLGKEVHVGMSQ